MGKFGFYFMAALDGFLDGIYLPASLLSMLTMWFGLTLTALTPAFWVVLGIIAVYIAWSFSANIGEEYIRQRRFAAFQEEHDELWQYMEDQHLYGMRDYALAPLVSLAPQPNSKTTPANFLSKAWRINRTASTGIKNGNRVSNVFRVVTTILILGVITGGVFTGGWGMMAFGLLMGISYGVLLLTSRHYNNKRNKVMMELAEDNARLRGIKQYHETINGKDYANAPRPRHTGNIQANEQKHGIQDSYMRVKQDLGGKRNQKDDGGTYSAPVYGSTSHLKDVPMSTFHGQDPSYGGGSNFLYPQFDRSRRSVPPPTGGASSFHNHDTDLHI